MIRAATGAKREIYCRSICLAFTVDIITANVSPLWKSSRPRRSILRQFYCHRRHQGPLRPETYSPSLKFSAPNMLGNPFYGAHLKTNGRWHQILNPVSSDTAPPTCLWTLVQISLGKGVGWGVGGVWGWQALKKFEESELADAGEAFARNKRTTLKPMERELWKEQLGRKVKELKRKMFEK